MKLMLLVPNKMRFSCVHFVDLIGTRLQSHGQIEAKEQTTIWANQENAAVARLVSEISTRCQGVSKATVKPDNLLQARDGTLTRILAPLLCGNAQRSVFVTVFDGPKYLAESQAALQVGTKAMGISWP
uniref:Uncharacterized protein n=1 Tax=Eutreptiella gymnastica TaxID=73025 RepID=A0A7S1N4E4_9EUGL